MISYELALKLKEAGFKMKNLKDWDMTQCPFPWGHFKYTDGQSYIYPVLSELIEACSPRFHTLTIGSDMWIAEAGFYDKETKQVGVVERGGKTPSEAVANLWLELNKK